MISFLLIICAGLIRIIAVIFLQRLNIRGKDLTLQENRKKVLIIRIADLLGLGLILLAILFAIIPALRKHQ